MIYILVFSLALPSPISLHVPVLGSLARNRPGGDCNRTASTILRAMTGLSLFGQLTYGTFTLLTNSRNASLPGWLFDPPPRPHTANADEKVEYRIGVCVSNL